jgi:hypothetical protein
MNHEITLTHEEFSCVLFNTSYNRSSLVVFRDGRARLQVTPCMSHESHLLQMPPGILSLFFLIPLSEEDTTVSIRSPASIMASSPDDMPALVITPKINGKPDRPMAWCPGLTGAGEAWGVLQRHQDISGVFLDGDTILLRNGDSLKVADYLIYYLKILGVKF